MKLKIYACEEVRELRRKLGLNPGYEAKKLHGIQRNRLWFLWA